MATRTARLTVRFSRDEAVQITELSRERGYLNPSAFVRAAVRNELANREGEISNAEQRIAATLDRLSRDIFRSNRGQQALFAVIDTFVKTFLTCVPEPPRDGISQSVARARDRYDRFVKSAGRAMVGDSEAALQDLVNRAQ